MIAQNEYHVPVLLKETIEGLAVKPDGVYVDCTLGGGGHFRRITELMDTSGIAIGIDRDPEAIARARRFDGSVKPHVIFRQSRFSAFDTVLKEHAIPAIDGLIADLGVSSRQIDDENRGFSYASDTKLDMRMDQGDATTAREIIEHSDEEGLARILAEYGEIGNPRRMAAALIRYSRTDTLATSADMRRCLEKEYGGAPQYKVLSKLFQALRIAVNNELEELEICLEKVVRHLKNGGRLAVIAYHSLEDRIVKNFMRENERRCICRPCDPVCTCGKPGSLRLVNRKAVCASVDEIRKNPRARSARLRIAEKIS